MASAFISLSTGECLTGKIHPGWHSDSTLLGRTLDLTAAYIQTTGCQPFSRLCQGDGGL